MEMGALVPKRHSEPVVNVAKAPEASEICNGRAIVIKIFTVFSKFHFPKVLRCEYFIYTFHYINTCFGSPELNQTPK